ncbi:DNA primase TraC [Candidatus Rubidus massiliensis]|nr:DNA primase TraC [Candidatus Rubidus massiliensis]
MYDIDGWLWNYQLLNPDGSKRDHKGGRIEGLFHSLGSLSDNLHVGVAESYVTAATCMENTGITCICCFGCNNIKNVISALANRYTKMQFTIFADNDRHLSQNQGALKAQEAREIYPGRVSIPCHP